MTAQPVARKPKKNSPVKLEVKWQRYQQRNREAAGIILANPQRYQGLPLEWAQAFMGSLKK